MIDPTFQTHEEVREFLKIELFKKMNEHGVDEITVTFDGCGDSGGIEEVFCDNQDFLKAQATTVSVRSSWTREGPTFQADISHNSTIQDLTEDLAYNILEQHHGGWEINAGSFGEFKILREEEAIKLEYNERIEDVETYDETY